MAASMTFMMVLVVTHSQATAYSSTASDCKTGACVTQYDDATAMMQSRAKVTLDVQTSKEDTGLLAKSAGMGSLMQARATERLAAAQKMESSMETAVMKMISGTGPTLPPEIFESIFTEMELIRKELLGEKDGLQTEINDANEVVAKCNENMQDTQSGAVATAKGHSDASKATHHTCRVAESSAYDAKNSSCVELASKTDTISKAAPQCNCPLSDIDTSAVLTCLASNRNWVASYETDLTTQKSDCDLKTTTWSSKADVCDSDQSNYELAFCSYAEATDDMCSTLDTCYNGAIASRNSTLYAVEMEEKHIKAVLASAKKIVCFLSILNKSTTDNLSMSDFEACKSMDVSSDRTYLSSSVPDLDITYPSADAKETCQTLTSTPGDGQWADTEYSAYTQEWLRETAMCLHMTTTTTAGASGSTCAIDETKDTKLGAISYWPPTDHYDTLPQGSLATINPSNGIFDSTQQNTETLAPNICSYKQVVATAAARGTRMLGYVSTGYFNHSCNMLGSCQTLARIEAQVQKYFEVFPNLSGIFFDEVAPTNWNCSAFPDEYATLRNIVKKFRPAANIAFNSGVPDNCVVDGVEAGEILALYESTADGYGAPCDSSWEQDTIWWATQTAKAKNIETWHLVHSASESQALAALQKARHYGVDWFYATNIGGDWQNGENTWGQPPVYWGTLKDQLHSPVAPEALQQVSATLSTHSSGQKFLTVKRPPAQCCSGFDWVGLYSMGTWDRVSYLNSYNEIDTTVVFPVDCLTEGAAAGDYEFKYLTGVDNWVAHNLAPTISIP